MLKDKTFKEKFAMLKTWMPEIIDSIKKDLRNEHLKKDAIFHKQYFNSKNPQKITSEELSDGYSKALQDGAQAEQLGEYISNRWLLKNSEVYYFFEKELTQITPNFNELEVMTLEDSKKLMESSSQQFGPMRAYVFSVMNSVVFPKEIYDQLNQKAVTAASQQKKAEQETEERQSYDEMKRSFEVQLARLSDKYEKKLAGLERKYHLDVDALKKQVSTLQRKLNG